MAVSGLKDLPISQAKKINEWLVGKRNEQSEFVQGACVVVRGGRLL